MRALRYGGMMGHNSEDKIILEPGGDAVLKHKKDTLRLLLFSLGSETYGVEVGSLREVVTVPQITAVPHAPGFVIGVFNLRGKITALLDIRSFFGLETGSVLREARIIVVDYQGSGVGILVDAINDTIEVEKKLIEPVLPTLKQELADYTVGHIEYAGDIIVILSLAKVLKCEAVEKLRSGGGI